MRAHVFLVGLGGALVIQNRLVGLVDAEAFLHRGADRFYFHAAMLLDDLQVGSHGLDAGIRQLEARMRIEPCKAGHGLLHLFGGNAERLGDFRIT